MAETTQVATADTKGKVVYIPNGEKESIELTIAACRLMFCKPTKSGVQPTDADVWKFMQLCRARELNPFVGDAYFVGYDDQQLGPVFTLITAVQALAKRAELHVLYRGMEYGIIVRRGEEILDLVGAFSLPGDVLLGGWATVYRDDRPNRPDRARIKLSSYNKNRSRWKDDPEGMIAKCARSAALREAFPTQLGGLYIEEELSMGEVLEGVFQKAEGGTPTVESGAKKSRAQRIKESAAPKAIEHAPAKEQFQKQEETRETVPAENEHEVQSESQFIPEDEPRRGEEELQRSEEEDIPPSQRQQPDPEPEPPAKESDFTKFKERLEACTTRSECAKLGQLVADRNSPFKLSSAEKKQATQMCDEKWASIQIK